MTAATPASNDTDSFKRAAAMRAAALVRDGMRLGLGTGSTAAHFVDMVGEKVAAGARLVCVPTSEQTRRQAESLAIPLTTLDETPELDLTVDGADEFDPHLRLIKGGGGALLREKIVASASARMVVITDRSKQVEVLGRFPLPVEVIPFGLEATRRAMQRAIASAGCSGELSVRLTRDGNIFATDAGNYIIDCSLGRIPDPEALAAALAPVPGVVEHGLFLAMADTVIIGDAAGTEILGSREGLS